MKSPNFQYLQKHHPHLHRLAVDAEGLCMSSPDLCLTRLRQLLECILTSILGNDRAVDNARRISELKYQGTISEQMSDAMHRLRKLGNTATHDAEASPSEAVFGLKLARAIAVWFHTLRNPQFKPSAFVPPPASKGDSEELKQELARLREKLTEQKQATLAAQSLASDLGQAKKAAEEESRAQYADLMAALDLATETEEKLKKAQDEFLEALSETEKAPEKPTQRAIDSAGLAFDEEMDEATTRRIIDQQLIDAGWEADSIKLRHARGTRPKHGRNIAIAEYPTSGGPADYVLFAGLIPIAAVEAKRDNTDVAGKIPQAQRYSRDFVAPEATTPAYEAEGRTVAWADDAEGHYHLPFVYSCNGRPFVKQIKEKSGTWFRDVRKPSNIKRPLHSFHSPDGLLDLLKRSKEEAEKKLKNEGFTYLKLRDYQQTAIEKVEAALETGKTECLLAMATGTGKTRTIVGLMYRFLKAERFKRILFLVDRTALGDQALDTFREAPLEQNQTLSTIYNVAELGDMAAEAETRIHVSTVQAMVQRIFNSDVAPNVDAYDCIIVDEAHRGYTLDQEMTEGELSSRDAARYLSSYRRVIDYFDAVKIGLTATPAKHTSEIFGKPVYTYSYREAVADDWLIDHEPPIRYVTLLSQNGIKFEKGEKVTAINTKTKKTETAELEDNMDFQVDAFNKRVITKKFNKVICKQLAEEIDPFGDEKTLIYCATDIHADMVKNLLDKRFSKKYDSLYNEASVRKITGKSDKVKQLIKRFKNERYPSIAITVDLLSTGIDVPKICHLVFLRRINSRILYEQMIGRATRRCDEIGKTTFKIYDPVDIYQALEDVNTMKPLVKDPKITLSELIEELQDPKTHSIPKPKDAQTSHAQDVLDTISQKLMRVLRKAEKESENKPDIKNKLREMEELLEVPPKKLHSHVRDLGPEEAARFFNKHTQLLSHLEQVRNLLGSNLYPIISDHEDALVTREQSYGDHSRPEDYLEDFKHFIELHVNDSAALKCVVTRPKDLTRAQLKEVKLLLDQHGFSRANLDTAWRTTTNQEIAASIIGYIRQAALGENLISFKQRVDLAMGHIYALHPWTTIQRKWLERLARQLTHEVVIDTDFINDAFSADGGAQRLDGLLGKRLDSVLSSLSDNLWKSA
ncbi:type I restriction-modification system endonuclease [Verrucomicrobiaceae bacterium 5K15]|uniref:Type I restriction-modification system endonuclease n=1 Tax=Oceaniferula flava TaxID=2800421 RepID=A0AAE2SES3_9BACT|nr:type I restriction-modification system endonuclease [Oceaniferula flavus]MBK1854991.1 type I restriction-modification system endonuclease [Oceaniferula flavus]MBM1136297.1 type I restriction-modification system endonuclease [Oceaniferula flavus]